MLTEDGLNTLQISDTDTERLRYWKKYMWVILSFLAALTISLAIINNYLQRRAVINHFKHEMSYAISAGISLMIISASVRFTRQNSSLLKTSNYTAIRKIGRSL